MSLQTIKLAMVMLLASIDVVSIQAQDTVTIVGQMVDRNHVTSNVTQRIITKQRRTTSQGDPSARLSYKLGAVPKLWAVPLAESLMARYPDYRTAYWKEYTYVQGYAFEALLRLYHLTGDARYLRYIRQYIDHFVDKDGHYKGGALTNLDNFMTGSTICNLYHETGEERYKKAAKEIYRHVATYPRSDGQFWHSNKVPNMWVDGVFMMQMFLIRYSQWIDQGGEPLGLACENVIAAARHLQRPDGLMLHAWTTQPEKTKWANAKGLSNEAWSEGMGWYALVVPELLAVLPKNHPAYRQIKDIYRKLVAGLVHYQDGITGGWWQIVDKGTHPLNFIDPSGTAMFIYSIQRGLDLHLLNGKAYQSAAERGYACLRQFLWINAHGLVDVYGGCDGINIRPNFIKYVTTPRLVNAKETVIGLLWAGIIMEKDYIKD